MPVSTPVKLKDPSMARKMLAVALLFVFTGLNGCGFQMRGDWHLPAILKKTTITGASRELYRELRANFEHASAILTTRDIKDKTATIRVYTDRVSRRTLSVGGTGKVTEFELYYLLEFDVVDASERVIVERQRMYMTQDFLYDRDNVIGTLGQADVLRDEMRKEMAGRVMRLLQHQTR